MYFVTGPKNVPQVSSAKHAAKTEKRPLWVVFLYAQIASIDILLITRPLLKVAHTLPPGGVGDWFFGE